jgi:hypothetical protein
VSSVVQALNHSDRTLAIASQSTTAMQLLRRRINPQSFAITLKQIAKHLKINPEHILNWEKWLPS